MDMFRQIAPDGIVNKQIVETKIAKEEAKEEPVNDGVMIAQEHNHQNASAHQHDLEPSAVLPKDISSSTGLPADAFVSHQGADVTKAVEMPYLIPGSTTGSQTKAVHASSLPVDHSHAISSFDDSDGSDKTWEKVDAPPQKELQKILQGDHPKGMEEAVAPEAGQAIAVPATSEETRLTHEELSSITPMECPFLMNRE